MGMASALETLCGQSYGAKQHHMLGIHLQRAMFVLVIVCIPVSIIWANTGQILMALGQDKDISIEAGLYAKWLIPALFAYGPLQCNIRFLQTQNTVIPMLVTSSVTTLFHLLVCWLLVFKSGLGNKGAALSNSISYWVNLMMLTVYIMLSPSCKNSWNGFSKEAFCDLLSFIKLAIPSAAMVCLEFWLFEFIVLLSGLLPNPKLETSVLSIIYNTSALIFMIPYGLGAAISTRVSNELGAGRPMVARMAVRVVLVLAVFVGLLVGLILILVQNIWGYAYSNEVEVVRYVSIMIPILATSNFVDGIQCVLASTARGSGWQKIGAFVNLGAYYVVGIPSAVLLAFVAHLGGKLRLEIAVVWFKLGTHRYSNKLLQLILFVQGLWMGIACGLTVQMSLLLIITLCTDWEKAARNARERVHKASTAVDLAA
ncbi:MATE efflux family protein DTX1 [Apostasia shenzhenica]|uniref:MATE efflux family protein DTX1 n=1 Tax=Apostasia shenzhenica TaxID=1088818 RepID=A0A2I0ALS8_9ASPA|nr:MATE efflux family protein DTX1 [Apostasia shenzhenica]